MALDAVPLNLATLPPLLAGSVLRRTSRTQLSVRLALSRGSPVSGWSAAGSSGAAPMVSQSSGLNAVACRFGTADIGPPFRCGGACSDACARLIVEEPLPRPFPFIMLLLALHGCAYHRLAVKNPNPPDQFYHPVETTAIGWGALEEQKVAEKCTTNLLSEVRVRTSLGRALLTVLSLGFVQPSRIEYRCSKLPTAEGEIQP